MCWVLNTRHHLTQTHFSPGWAQTRSSRPTALLYQCQISVKEKELTLLCCSNQSRTATPMQTLTASLLRRSCSFLRAISLSFSKGIWAIKACPVADFGSSSSRVSNAVFVQMFSIRSASFLTASRFSSILHRFSWLKNKEALESSRWRQSEYWTSLLNTSFFQEMLSSHFLPPVSSGLSHVPSLRQPCGNAGRHLWTTSQRPGPLTDWPVLPRSQHFLGQLPTQRVFEIISEIQNSSRADVIFKTMQISQLLDIERIQSLEVF